MNTNKQVNLGEVFDLTLEEASSAGYQISLNFSNEEFELLETKYPSKEAKKDEEIMIGGASIKVFIMKSLKKGNFQIESQSQRVFEKNVKPTITEIKITVV